MNQSKTSIVETIRQIIKESSNIIVETQKGKKIDAQIDNLMSSLTLNIEDESINKEVVMKEIGRSLDYKINKVLSSQYEYPNFYIVKLGSFVLKDNEKEEPISLSMEGFIKTFSYPYLYVYHDTAIVLRFGSGFYDSDAVMIKDVEKFIKHNKINFNTMHETGNRIIVDSTFNTNNVIDLTDYSKIKSPDLGPKEPALAKEKVSYRVGGRVNHPAFGKGTIKKTKRHGFDEEGNTLYNVTIDFGGKEKTLRMKEK